MITLYKKSNHEGVAKIAYWSAIPEGDGFTTEWGYIERGQECLMGEHFESILEGKQGRDVDEQIDSRIESKANGKRDAGYVDTVADASVGNATNAMNLAKPMLAVRFDRTPAFSVIGCGVQYKYDGHRCLIHRKLNGDYVAYSRNGKPIKTIGHILDSLSLTKGITVDGELYHHGTALQTISSWVKRSQFDSQKLKYHIYDVLKPWEYANRYATLLNKDIVRVDNMNVEIVPTWFDKRNEDIPELLGAARSAGYEGIIIRRNIKGYEDGKRAKQLVKVKAFFDDEFIVIGIKESRDGWAILSCLMPSGKEFSVSAPGTIGQKTRVLIDADDFIGKAVRVEYANLTKDGKPFHPVATGWRSKEVE